LEQSVKALTANKSSALSIMLTSVEMPIMGQIPDTFIHETGERLAWYQRLISSENNTELQAHFSELDDLYGYLPPEVGPLKASIEKHILLRDWGIKKVEQEGEALRVSLHEDAPSGTKVMFQLMFSGIEAGDRLNQLLIPDLGIESLYSALLDNKRK
jgi:transcription-repair coupling factor (superfamily II helicase)